MKRSLPEKIVEEARRLYTTTNLTLREISEQLGYTIRYPVVAGLTYKRSHYRKPLPRKHKKGAKGERNSQSKLTRADVAAIKWRREHGDTVSQLARDYDVSRSCIQQIMKGQIWGNVTPTQPVQKRGRAAIYCSVKCDNETSSLPEGGVGHSPPIIPVETNMSQRVETNLVARASEDANQSAEADLKVPDPSPEAAQAAIEKNKRDEEDKDARSE